MRKPFLFLSTVLLLVQATFAPRHTVAYEVETHEQISERAVIQSANLGAALPTLGLTSLNDRLVFLPAQGGNRTVLEWLRFGSREEDTLFEVGSPLARFRHHFYNPLNGSGLYFVPGLPCNVTAIAGIPSPDWALEENGETQDYSFPDARTALHKGLTEQSAAEREKNLALLFRTLGQVIHHLQDMAQPQHTRNDPHGPLCLGVERGSFYERYTNEEDVRGVLPYLGYEAVYGETDTTTFNAPRNFWTTDGKGIADYSNRGFVTTGTNFDKPGLFPSPVLGPGWEEDQTDLCTQLNLPRPTGPDSQPLPCVMTFIATPVQDAYRPGNAVNRKASTYSIFNADLNAYNAEVTYTDPSTEQAFTTRQLYTLNRFNFDAAHQFLIPRAVAYSAGLINYFFRGKIAVVPDDQVAGQDLIQNEGTELLKGTFFLYYDATDGKRYPVLRDAAGKAAGWTTPPDGLAAGATMPLPVFLPPTDATTPGEYMLVFHGTMGEETDHAVAGRVVQTSPCPTTQPLPTYGITEWWGPGCVRLAWHGPFARYSTMRHTSELSEHIFSHGRAVATAPGRVIGTALQRDAQSGQQFLLAVVAGTESSGGVQFPNSPDRTGWVTSEKLYARGLQSPAEWVLVRQFGVDLDNGTAYPAPYYFNESGTKAVNGRITFLSVTAASGEASRYKDPGPTHEPINHSTHTDCDPTSLSCSSSSTSDSSSESEMAADYRGDHLVRLYWHGQDHYESSNTRSRDSSSFAGSSSGGAAWTSSQWLTTTTGWEWDLTQAVGSGFGSNEWTDYHERTTLDSKQFHQTSLTRRVDSLDLRFNPPLVAYVERQYTYDSEYRGGHDNFYVWQVSLDNTTEMTQEQFTWLIHGGEYDVERLHSLPRNHPGHFAGGNASEITVGGTSAHPQIQAAHYYLDFVVDGDSYEGFRRNFDYAGDSGGPER